MDRKLELHRETLRTLQEPKMRGIFGGRQAPEKEEVPTYSEFPCNMTDMCSVDGEGTACA